MAYDLDVGLLMTSLPFCGILFDLDGTLVNSLPAVERAWGTWAIENDLDPTIILPAIHGRRAIDSIAVLAPHLDQARAFARLEHLEATDTTGVSPLPGALSFIESLTMPWGIVTSGTSPIAIPRLAAAGIGRPDVFVTGEEVPNGKPDPAPFLEGVRRLGLAAKDVIAFEDTLAGVRSAKRAGLRVISLGEDGAAEADVTVPDYMGLQVMHKEGDEFLLLIQ